jgi:hypothetical protein
VTILAKGRRDSPMSIVQLKSQYRTVKDRASETPHQFRTRNNPNKPKRTRSKSNENQVKSTKLIDILPLITVWLQVRVLPGPPANQWLSCFFHFVSCWSPHQKYPASLLQVVVHQSSSYFCSFDPTTISPRDRRFGGNFAM